jgi:hypothetical protein
MVVAAALLVHLFRVNSSKMTEAEKAAKQKALLSYSLAPRKVNLFYPLLVQF